MREMLFRLASRLKAATCWHWWEVVPNPGGGMWRVAASDDLEVRFHCRSCDSYLVRSGKPGEEIAVALGPTPLRQTLAALWSGFRRGWNTGRI